MNRQRKFAMILALTLAILMLLSLVIGFLPAAQAAPTTSEIEKLKRNAEALKSEKTRIANELASIRNESSDAIREKEALDQQIEVLQSEIENTTLLISGLSGEIASKQQELETAIVEESQQMELFRTRLRVMEETSEMSYLGLLLGSENFADFLSTMDMISEITEYDQGIMDRMRESKAKIEEAKSALEDDKLVQLDAKGSLAGQQLELVAQYEAANEFIAELQKDQVASEQEYKEVEERVRKEEEDIANAQKEYEAERKRLEAEKLRNNISINYVGGTYLWPVPGYGAGSAYGYRIHPILKVNKLHAGQDIPAPTGTTIVAANTGTVITAKYSSSYGNYVVIDHGGGNCTLYAHMSKILVSNGQSVTKGDTIGKVGTTGMSTGAHLHFEVIVNGKQVNPMQYFS